MLMGIASSPERSVVINEEMCQRMSDLAETRGIIARSKQASVAIKAHLASLRQAAPPQAFTADTISGSSTLNRFTASSFK